MPTQFSQFIIGGNLLAGDLLAGLRNNLNTLFIPPTGGSSGGVTVAINQPLNGFLIGQLLYVNGPGTFARADATLPATANMIGIVVQIIDANNFVLQLIGLTPTIVPQVNPAIAALVPGTVYYLSDAVPGSYTPIAPVTPGHVLKPVFIAFTVNTAFLFNWQGNVI